MDAKKVLIFSIIFIVTGLLFMIFGLMARASENSKNEDKSKSGFGKIAGTIYLILGAITFALGLMAAVLRKEIPWFTVQVISVFYLLIVAIISLVFSMIVKTKTDFNMKNSYDKSSGSEK